MARSSAPKYLKACYSIGNMIKSLIGNPLMVVKCVDVKKAKKYYITDSIDDYVLYLKSPRDIWSDEIHKSSRDHIPSHSYEYFR